jgi:hypothetical protein
MVSESCPTNFRSSAAGDQGLIRRGGLSCRLRRDDPLTPSSPPVPLQYLISSISALPIPGVLGAILVIVFQGHETKGIDLIPFKGDEWDKLPADAK